MTTGEGQTSDIGLIGLAVMGQNLALNVAEKGFKISVFNRSADKTDACVARAQKEGLGGNLAGFKEMKDFVASLQRPRRVIILVKAGAPVDATIEALSEYMEEGDIIIDGGNEWYENTERRQAALKGKGIIEIGMGVSGGEEGARRGPAMMPGGDADAYKYLAPIVEKVAAQTDDGACVTYIGPGGSGNFVKMVHNGIEYGDMQLIAEAYDLLKTVGGLSNEELAAVFDEWNKSELESFLVEITASIFKKKDEYADGFLVDKVLDKTGMKVRCRGGRRRRRLLLLRRSSSSSFSSGGACVRGWATASAKKRRSVEQKFFSLWIRTIDLGVMGPARYHCAKLNAG